MSALLCCRRPRAADMGAALSQEGSCEAAGLPQPPTMADVIRERKKKGGGAALGTLRRRIAAAARRPRDPRPDRGCEHARYIRSIVSTWSVAEVFLLAAELEAGAALRDLAVQADLARPPAPSLASDLQGLLENRWWCDVELVGCGWSLPAHRAILAARSAYFRHLLPRHPNARRVPLEGAIGSWPRDVMAAAILVLYGHTCNTSGWDRGAGSDTELDNAESSQTNTWDQRPRHACCSSGGTLRRLTTALLASRAALHSDANYLLDSGEMADARLSFGGGGDLPCHRAILAARSRLFRKVLSARGASDEPRVIHIDEKVLPRRFAPALLHAAYTDQVDLSLIQRAPSSPTSTNSSGTSNAAWPGSGGRGSHSAQLEDAFQLYEIARFMEMPILAQGCEERLVAQLSPATLPRLLRWAVQPHASRYVHRQAMRYLLDEFHTVMSSPHGPRVPRAALARALASSELQCSEPQALRAVLRWAEHAPNNTQQPKPNVIWHTAHSSRRGGGRRSVSDAQLRHTQGDLLALVRTEHIPQDNDALQQAIRRGILAPPSLEASSADAWLGRPPHRPPRCFLPYLDELKALLEDQQVPEAELARVRRTRYLNRIPDTLYMVAAERSAPVDAPSLSLVPCALRAALLARHRELRAAPRAQTALALPLARPETVAAQLALRCAREMSLPDSCADLLLAENDEQDREGAWSECEEGQQREAASSRPREPCCRSSSAGLSSAGSLSSAEHQLINDCGGKSWRRATVEPRPPAAAAVPDVALAPNANTHLLCPPQHSFSGMGVLQLDLGDGATHTPRPGSRALRAASQHARHRDHTQQLTMARSRVLPDDDDLRAAIEMSVMRAYSSMAPAVARTLPHRHATHRVPVPPRRLSPSPSARSRREHDHMDLRAIEACQLDGASPVPRRHYRLEPGSYGGSSHSSRGPSPSDYA